MPNMPDACAEVSDNVTKDLLVPDMSAKLMVSASLKSRSEQRLIVALGYLGLLPMLFCVLLMETSFGLSLLKAYSLSILSFLCGNWWATALMRSNNRPGDVQQVLLLSNVMVITAVISVTFMGHLSLIVLALLFGCLVLGERYVAVFRRQPVYYRSMRVVVTTIAVALHLAAYAGSR